MNLARKIHVSSLWSLTFRRRFDRQISGGFPKPFHQYRRRRASDDRLVRGHGATRVKAFAYTIATFSVFRPYEMIRDDLCYQDLPVTVVGIGGGVTYSTLAAPIMRWRTWRL